MIDERIKKRLKALSLKQVDLVEATGAAKSTVHGWLNGLTVPKGKPLLKLARKLDADPEWLLEGGTFKPFSEPGVNKLPLIQLVGKRIEENFLSACPVINDAVFANARVNREKAAFVEVTSSYLEPLVPEGTFVAIDKESKTIKDRDIYAIRIADNLHVKILQRTSDDRLLLKNFNPAFPDEEFTREQAKEIEVLGRVFWWSVVR